MNPRYTRFLPTLIVGSIGLAGLAGAWFMPNETTVTEVAPGVFFRKCQTEPEFLGCNQGWVVFDEFVLVIDANFPNQAKEVIELIRQQTDKPIRYVFDTHYHGDHADGNQQYTRIGATAVANENSRELFATRGIAGFRESQMSKSEEYADLTYEEPTLYFPGRLVIDDGTQRVELLHFGHAHTAGDAVAWLPEQGILFTGDACVNGAFNYTGDSDTASWIAVLTQMKTIEPTTICPGHGEMATADLIDTQRRYFVELRQAVQQGIDAGKSVDEIKESIDLPWYEEWTGVDVKTRTENIEHVYAELTGGTGAG